MNNNTRTQPLVVGVTGHRYINPENKPLLQLIQQKLQEIRKENPERSFIILSGLAEGADRMVAEAAMKTLDASLVSVLALPEQEFEKDFNSQTSVKAFRNLISRSSAIITAPFLSKTAWKEYTSSRNHQYAWIGAFIAHHSEILIALWDGEPAKGLGGTANVVKWFKQNSYPKKYNEQSAELAANANVPIPVNPDRRCLIHLPV